MGLEERTARADLLIAVERACDRSSKSWTAEWSDDGSRVVIDFPRIAELAAAQAEADEEPLEAEPAELEEAEAEAEDEDGGEDTAPAFEDEGQPVGELRELLRARGLPVSGRRDDLVARLTE